MKSGEPRTLGVAEIPIQSMGDRLVLRDGWIDGNHEDGRTFEITRSFGSPHLVVSIETGNKRRHFVADVTALVERALELDAELRDAEGLGWRRPEGVHNDAE